jgi:hypothetical protein
LVLDLKMRCKALFHVPKGELLLAAADGKSTLLLNSIFDMLAQAGLTVDMSTRGSIVSVAIQEMWLKPISSLTITLQPFIFAAGQRLCIYGCSQELAAGAGTEHPLAGWYSKLLSSVCMK